MDKLNIGKLPAAPARKMNTDGPVKPQAGKPKTLSGQKAHDGMVHNVTTAAGNLAVKGISRTAAQEILDPNIGEIHGGGESPATPLLMKQQIFAPAPIHSGMTPAQKAAASDHMTVGNKVMSEAVASGSTKLPESVSDSDAKPVRQPGDCK